MGENSRVDDLDVNASKPKKLTNMRAVLGRRTRPPDPAAPLSLEQALEFIRDDETVEVTPKSIRLRKVELNASTRQTARPRARSGNAPALESGARRASSRPRRGCCAKRGHCRDHRADATASGRSSRPRRWCWRAQTATSSLEDLAWSGWGAATATASGEYAQTTADPYCAAGTFRTYLGERDGDGAEDVPQRPAEYTHLEWSTQAKPPPGQAIRRARCRSCSWALHPGLSATPTNGKTVISGKYWAAATACPWKVTLRGRDREPVALSAKGTFSYAWRAPAGSASWSRAWSAVAARTFRSLARPALGLQLGRAAR